MEPFSAIGRSLSTRRVSARRQETEDSREENGIPTPAIGANATNFHHPGAGSVQITKKASPWAGLLCFVFPLLETAEARFSPFLIRWIQSLFIVIWRWQSGRPTSPGLPESVPLQVQSLSPRRGYQFG